jgi:hypothetical protein
MAVKALPLLLLSGAALVLMPKRKTSTKKKESRKPAREKPEEEKQEDLDEEDDEPVTPEPKPSPEPSPGPGPVPEPPVIPDDEGPYGKPPIGPSGVGSCANPVYNRDPEYFTPEVTVAQKALVRFSEPEMFFYIRNPMQTKIYNYMLGRFEAQKKGQERRTVASVVLRDALEHVNSGCKWDHAASTLTKPEQLVWEGGARLSVMAQITAGLDDPKQSQLFQTGSRYTVTRASLGDPDEGFGGSNPNPGQRVEFIGTDSSLEHAEHIIAELIKLTGPQGEPDMFEVRVVEKFQGHNVAPKMRAQHGFKVGSNAFFSKKGPTGIYRLFPAGME